MVDNTQESTENELNQDSTIGLFKIMSLFANPAMQQGTDDDSNSYFSINQFKALSPNELNTIFRSSYLARKIIEKYPKEAKTLGYTLEKPNGEVIQKNDELLLEIIYESSIWSRLYGHCYTIFKYEKSMPNEPVKSGEKLTGYIIEFSLTKDGDYFIKGDEDIFHESKVQIFYGRKTYIPYITPYEDNYADSIFQSLAISLRNYVSSNETSRKILSNISYLLLGVKNLGNMSKTDKGREEVMMRLQSIRINRNTNRVITYDKENEIINYISQAVTGITDLIANVKEIFIAESDYPPEQLFEEGSKQSIGSGIANQLIARFLWAKRVHGYAITEFLPQYKLYFNRHYPNQNLVINIPFKMTLTDMEQAELEKAASERNKNLIESKIISPEEARTAYKTDEFDLNIILDDELYKNMKETSIDTGEINNNEILNGEQPTNRTTSLKGDKNINTDATYLPDDTIWDNLANITEAELDEIMRGAINE